VKSARCYLFFSCLRSTLNGCCCTNFRLRHFTPAGGATREAADACISTSGEFDGVIDFDAAVRGPANPPHLLPAFDSGDRLHPSDAGYQAMANAIDLRPFRGEFGDRD
jgi:GDSL-like lipase/acylhydrolase family protein